MAKLSEWSCFALPWIDVRRGFVQHEYFIISHQSPGQTNQLPLAHAEIQTASGHFGVQTAGQILDRFFKLHLNKIWMIKKKKNKNQR